MNSKRIIYDHDDDDDNEEEIMKYSQNLIDKKTKSQLLVSVNKTYEKNIRIQLTLTN
jgi:hypothetical protein